MHEIPAVNRSEMPGMTPERGGDRENTKVEPEF